MLLLLLPLLPAALACDSKNGQVCITILNKCSIPIWPGIMGQSKTPNPSGFKLDAGKSRSISVPDGWTAGRIWARTGCNGQFNCETGNCGSSEQCSGRGGEPPASLAEFTLNGNGGQDYYDVSLVDGYNLPVTIYPNQDTFNTNGGQYDCKKAGSCGQNLNDICPPELKKVVNGRTVGCKSACLALNTDQYCCRGQFNQPQTCVASKWPKNYPAIFKKACPTAYSYAYDDKTSTFTCRGKGTKSPVYTVQFC